MIRNANAFYVFSDQYNTVRGKYGHITVAWHNSDQGHSESSLQEKYPF